ncbi:anti-sigma factor [Planctomonas psychrotolerans]|uniref:anti-sigma factor n=1 Tax=Planctomonas psychrotolerans TaxID=2528712 RepID=UPI00123AF15C|nr:anti-sigma factor [Planctomonas psychrotolerans]
MHTDPDLLALLALGEDVATAEELDHLADCAECATRRASLTAAANAGRSASVALVRPSDRVWQSISAELGLRLPVAAPSSVASPAPPVSAAPISASVSASALPASGGDTAPPVDLASHRSDRRDVLRAGSTPVRRWMPWLAAAAVAVVGGSLVASIAITLQSTDPAPTAPPAEQLAEAALDPLPDWPGASGGAVVRESAGIRTIDITVSSEIPENAIREVWLISSDLTRLVSIGMLSGDAGSFDIPPEIDLVEYAVVDVSAEPLDGDPGHSSDSIVRGVLGS